MIISELEKTVSSIKQHANNVKRGMDLFRNIEFPLTIKLLDPKKNEKILDVGCGQSILPTFIVKEFGSNILAGIWKQHSCYSCARNMTYTKKIF
jgi:tRNA1(Val) A37 N6-methylase TrmN6